MEQKNLSSFTDQELLEEAKKTKLGPILYALFIGFCAGIIFYSVAKNSWGLLTFIPLILIFKAVKDSKRNVELEKVLKERNLH